MVKRVERIEPYVVKKVVPVYVAEDGTEFTSEGDCRAYETKKRLDPLSVIERCENIDGYANFDGGEHTDYHKYIWCRPKSTVEIDSLRATYNDRGFYFPYTMVGKWICLEFSSYDDEFVYATSLDDGIEYAKNILQKLGYDMVVTERDK